MNIQYLRSLVREFIAIPHETEWLEFKCNFADPQSIGEYLSALSNSASRIIADTLEKNLIKRHDPENLSKRQSKYVPFWA